MIAGTFEGLIPTMTSMSCVARGLPWRLEAVDPVTTYGMPASSNTRVRWINSSSCDIDESVRDITAAIHLVRTSDLPFLILPSTIVGCNPSIQRISSVAALVSFDEAAQC